MRQRPTLDAALKGVRYAISAIGATRKDPANSPEFVDFQGVRNLAEAAAAAKLAQLVIVSSSGVTHKDHMLNKMFDNVMHLEGRGRGGGPGERGALHHRPARWPHRQAGRASTGSAWSRAMQGTGVIPRADVARVCVAALKSPAARDRTFELFGAQTPPVTDWNALFAPLKPDADWR